MQKEPIRQSHCFDRIKFWSFPHEFQLSNCLFDSNTCANMMSETTNVLHCTKDQQAATDRQTDQQTDTDRQTPRQTGRQADSQPDSRQTDRKTEDIQTDRQISAHSLFLLFSFFFAPLSLFLCLSLARSLARCHCIILHCVLT